jgi:hypothetical protein
VAEVPVTADLEAGLVEAAVPIVIGETETKVRAIVARAHGLRSIGCGHNSDTLKEFSEGGQQWEMY